MLDTELTVVVADDDETSRSVTVDALDAAGLDVIPQNSIEAVVDALGREVDCIVSAATLTDGDVFDLVRRVRNSKPDTPVILFADELPQERDAEATDLVFGYLSRSVVDAHERLVSLVSEVTLGSYQIAYPVPEDEQARLEALRNYDVRDRGAVDAFDRLTQLVTSHFEIAVAFVGLVDQNEERFVACEGANWKTLAREDTICTHTILEDEVMVVEDVTEDPRFAGNDRLRELDIRSYAGARLTTPEGHAIGALCCLDDEPRSFSDEELDDLRLFADEAMEQLILRRRLNERTGPMGDQ